MRKLVLNPPRGRSAGAQLAMVILALTLGSGAESPAWAQNNRALREVPPQEAPGEKTPELDAPAQGDEPPPEPEGPLFKQEPYDLVTLDDKHESEVFKVKPIEFTGNDTRYKHDDHRLTDKLIVQLVNDPGKRYEILWRHIDNIQLFEQMVLRQAEGVVAEARVGRNQSDNGKLDEAYEYYEFLLKNYPDLPGLQESLQNYRFMNAAVLYQQQRYAEALAILEDLYAQNRSYQRGQTSVAAAMSGAIHQLLTSYAAKKDFFHARKLLKRLNDTYDSQQVASIAAWRRQFEQRAGQLRDQARAKLEADQLREARQLSREMASIWPDVEGGQQLIADLAQAYPLLIVGVPDPALAYDAASLHNWGARRAGRILHRTLMQYMGRGPSGGRYECALGTVDVSEDRQQITLQLNSESLGGELTSFDISNRLLAMTRLGDPGYTPAWAALMEGVQVADVYQVEIAFRRPFVLPQALMQFPVELASSSEKAEANSPLLTGLGSGLYELVSREKGDALYGINRRVYRAGGRRPVEVLERYFAQPEQAIIALQRGEIDIIDRLAPADVARFEESESLIVERYALPTVHALVSSRANDFMKKTGFRRGLAYSINRDLILNRGILKTAKMEGCQPITGPFVAGIGSNDAAAYAYDRTVQPFNYDPVLGKILMEITLQELIVTAEKTKQQPPTEIPPITIGYPAREAPRTACKLIQEQLQALELQVKLKEFPPGVTTDAQKECDLVYTELFMWEPIVDARRLLGDEGLAPAHNYYVDLALQQLDVCKTWKEARLRLNELHHYAHNEAVVIPLWQISEHFVHHRRVRGIGRNPAFLYQDILQWRLVPDDPEKSER